MEALSLCCQVRPSQREGVHAPTPSSVLREAERRSGPLNKEPEGAVLLGRIDQCMSRRFAEGHEILGRRRIGSHDFKHRALGHFRKRFFRLQYGNWAGQPCRIETAVGHGMLFFPGNVGDLPAFGRLRCRRRAPGAQPL